MIHWFVEIANKASFYLIESCQIIMASYLILAPHIRRTMSLDLETIVRIEYNIKKVSIKTIFQSHFFHFTRVNVRYATQNGFY